MDNSILTVYKSPFTKIRLGRLNDGGYVFADIPSIQYDILLAGGIETDISFEHDFVNKYNCSCIACDGTIESINNTDQRITFVKKNIAGYTDDLTTNLHDEINANQSIFIKMNIEGGEYAWIQSLNTTHFDKFDQIVIEFHHPISKYDILKKVNETHYLIHFHGNNCCGVLNHRGVNIPNVFQCTYLHKKYITSPELNTDVIPGPLDMNNIGGDDIFIDYPPFVYKIVVPVDTTPVDPVDTTPVDPVDTTTVDPVDTTTVDPV